MDKEPKPLKIRSAPREKLRFVEQLGDLFLRRVLDHEEAFVTDRTLISDFQNSTYEIENALRPGSRPGWYVFKKRKSLRGNIHSLMARGGLRQRLDQIPDEEVEAKPTYFRREVIRKAFRVFAVDISPVFDRFLPEVLHYIAAHIPESKRAGVQLRLRKPR